MFRPKQPQAPCVGVYEPPRAQVSILWQGVRVQGYRTTMDRGGYALNSP
jgi:hypothetical protein